MPNLNISLQNFASGELSPKMRGRFDLQVYFNGLERMQNFISETTGGASFRPGFKYVHTTKNNKPAAMYPFQYNDEQSYMLEFTEGFVRVYSGGKNVVEPAKIITGATAANPVVITSTAHLYSNGDEVFINQVTGMTQLNGKSYVVANVTANTYELTDIDGNNIDGTGFDAYISGGISEKIFEVASPYLEEEIFNIKHDQNANIMYLVHPNHEPMKFTRTAPSTFTLSTFSRGPMDPFSGVGNYPRAVAFYESRLCYGGTLNDPLTLFLSETPDLDGNTKYDLFDTGTGQPEDAIIVTIAAEGNVIRWLKGTNRFLAVGTYATELRVSGSREDEALTPDNINIRPISSLGVADMNPVSQDQVIMFTQRGRRTLRSFQFDLSTDSYIPLDRNLIADHMTAGLVKQIAFQSGRPNILWAVKKNGEMIGMTFEQKEEVAGWHRHLTRVGDSFESCNTLPQDDGFEELWTVVKRSINGVDRYYVELLADTIEFNEPFDFFSGDETLDQKRFLNSMFEKQKDYIYCDSALTFDGTTTGLDAGADITPAATTGNSINFSASAPVFSADMVGREIWKKTIDGTEEGRAVITVFNSSTSVDCNIVKDFDTTNVMLAGNWYLTSNLITGLDHLENEELAIIADGGEHPKKTVSNGAVTLDNQVSKAHFGLPYTGFIKTMNLETPTQTGIGQTKPKNIHQLGIRFFNTLGASFGSDIYKLEQILFRKTSDFTNRPPSLFTGDKVVSFSDSWNKSKFIIVQQNSPLPCTVQMLVPYFNIQEPFTGQ